tara:strand:- start:407 stop:511 length:105 start_codon:yes stop_codon:yes gene_type:complete
MDEVFLIRGIAIIIANNITIVVGLINVAIAIVSD